MDIEMVREIIMAFKDLGGDAKEAFVWYLVVTYVPAYLIGATWTIGGLLALRKGIDALCSIVPSGRLLKAYGSDICWTDRELDDACRILQDAKKPRK